MQEYTGRVLTHSPTWTIQVSDSNSNESFELPAKTTGPSKDNFIWFLLFWKSSVHCCLPSLQIISWTGLQNPGSSCPFYFLGCLVAHWEGCLDKAFWGKNMPLHIIITIIFYCLDFQVCILLCNTCGPWRGYAGTLLGIPTFSEGIRPFTTTETKVSSTPPSTL